MPRTINYFGQDVTLPATTVRIIDTAANIRESLKIVYGPPRAPGAVGTSELRAVP